MKLELRIVGTLIVAFGLTVAADAQLDFFDTNVPFLGSFARPLDGIGEHATISPDGTFVSFVSTRHGLRTGDLPNTPDVFVRELASTRVFNVNKVGGKAVAFKPGPSNLPTLTTNQGLVTFFASASPIKGVSTAMDQIYAHTRETGTTVLASVPPSGTSTLASCTPVAIDSAGTRLLFRSKDAAQRSTLYLRDLSSGDTRSIFKSAPFYYSNAVLSQNGQNILYTAGTGLVLDQNGVKRTIISSTALDLNLLWVSDDAKTAIISTFGPLDPTDPNGFDIYEFNLETSQAVLLPSASNRLQSFVPAVSANGRYVCVALEPSVYENRLSIFDRESRLWTDATPYQDFTERPTRLSVDNFGNNIVYNTATGKPAWGVKARKLPKAVEDIGQRNVANDIFHFHVTQDERFAFIRSSTATSGDKLQSIRKDMISGGTVIVPNNLNPVAVSTNGRYVVGESEAPMLWQHVDLKAGIIVNLPGRPVGMDGSGNLVVMQVGNQVWVRNIARREEYLLSYTIFGVGGDDLSDGGEISSDGRYVYFTSFAMNLAAGRQILRLGAEDFRTRSVYRWDSKTRNTVLIEIPRRNGSFEGAQEPKTSADGRFVAVTETTSSHGSQPLILDTLTGRYLRGDGTTPGKVKSIAPDGQHALVRQGDEGEAISVFRFSDGKYLELPDCRSWGTFTTGKMTNNRRVWLSVGGTIVRGRYEFR